jgi:hypothetical protein
MGNTVKAEEIVSQKKQFEYKTTDVPEVDAIYKRATALLDEFEGYRIKLQERIQQAHTIAGTTQAPDLTAVLPFKVMLSAFSALNHGDVKSVITFDTRERVQINVKKTKDVSDKLWNLYELLNEFMDIYHKTVQLAPDLNDRIEIILMDMSNLNKLVFVKTHTSKNHVSRREFDAVVEHNELTFLAMNKALIEWNNLHLKLGREYRNIIQNLDNHLKEADEVGRDAAEKKITDPAEVYDTFIKTAKK